MFGYIKPYSPELKIKEWNSFRSIYCGLCKELSHEYGPVSSLLLSYDFTFLATIFSGLRKTSNACIVRRCPVHPLRKKLCLTECADLKYCAAAVILMFFYKLKDDLSDHGIWHKLRALFFLPFLLPARQKARQNYPQMEATFSLAIRRQGEAERSLEKSIDRAADPTASALSSLCVEMAKDDSQKAVLSRFGYLTGRYVYLCDALDDLETDYKMKNYNPYLQKYQDTGLNNNEIKKYAAESIRLTIGEIAAAYELLTFSHNKPILDNIIYFGLPARLQEILDKDKPKNERKTLYEQPL